MQDSFQASQLKSGRASNHNTQLVWGFTLVEIAVVIGITAVLTAILVVYTSSSKAQIIFFKEQSLLVKSVLRAKAFAIESFQPKQDPGIPSSRETICGWGVYFDTAPNANGRYQYLIFRDVSVNSSCLFPDTDGVWSGSSETFEVFELDPAVKVSCLSYEQTTGSPCGAGTTQSAFNLVFVPPEPKVVFAPSMLQGDAEAVVRLELADGSRGSDIRIGLNGQINF